MRIPSAVAFDLASIAFASPSAFKMKDYLFPSAVFIFAYRVPSELRISALFYLSLSAYNSIAFYMLGGVWISLISYLMHYIPHCLETLFRAVTILWFKLSRSSNVLSNDNLPNSLLIVVYANWVIASIGFPMPYDALYGSVIRRYNTPSICIVTLSFVMAI